MHLASTIPIPSRITRPAQDATSRTSPWIPLLLPRSAPLTLTWVKPPRETIHLSLCHSAVWFRSRCENRQYLHGCQGNVPFSLWPRRYHRDKRGQSNRSQDVFSAFEVATHQLVPFSFIGSLCEKSTRTSTASVVSPALTKEENRCERGQLQC